MVIKEKGKDNGFDQKLIAAIVIPVFVVVAATVSGLVLLVIIIIDWFRLL